ncbi:MAG: ribosome silencing factor [Dehalococcoidales bacterium]|nr:ribosome silencing factor [Dehalococcoidales bacterium]
MEPIDIARLAVEAASDKQANDIVLLDTRNICGFTDYFVIGSSESDRQLLAVHDEIEARLKQAGIRTLHSEGSAGSGWMVLDYGSVIVHVFSPKEREYYQLEKLWETGNLVVRIQ